MQSKRNFEAIKSIGFAILSNEVTIKNT